MSSTLKDIRPPVVHHEHSAWPQRYGTLIGVVGLHVLAGSFLVAMKLRAPAEIEPPVLSVQWVPTQQAPEQKQPQEKPKEPPKKKPEPVQKAVPVPQQVKPVEAPMIQAPATTAAAVEAPQTPPAPPTPPAPAPQPQAVQASAPPIDPNLKPSVDCTQSPQPVYPAASKTLGEEGSVLLRMQVDERGRPLRVEVEKSSGHTRLDRSARETIASSWVCPLRQGKQGYTGWLRVPVVFELSLN
ncbi:energy transducer TonB [Uliginosibacterium sp. H3]|uniref:Protein TonB n=1 Tax=Uliginosibacterium silvisoli TaxID=3114758 RepID=A0ABU6K822_9RHOO|nr:energy transducer TonB [Uliginosibacterium sp. H3]